MDALMTRLSLEEGMNMLSIDSINGTPKQVERIRIWIEGLAEKRGNTYVMENRRNLLDQLEQHMKLKIESCC
jgi:hypothetical protein